MDQDDEKKNKRCGGRQNQDKKIGFLSFLLLNFDLNSSGRHGQQLIKLLYIHCIYFKLASALISSPHYSHRSSIRPGECTKKGQPGDVGHDVRIDAVDRIPGLMIVEMGPVGVKGDAGNALLKK
jgi:hypothetical protein